MSPRSVTAPFRLVGTSASPVILPPGTSPSSRQNVVKASEGNVRHVEASRMDSVRTSILGDLDPYTGNDAPASTTPPIAKSRKSSQTIR